MRATTKIVALALTLGALGLPGGCSALFDGSDLHGGSGGSGGGGGGGAGGGGGGGGGGGITCMPAATITLATPASIITGGTTSDSIAVGDFDGNGIVDLVTGNHDSHDVSIMLGDGNGGFALANNATVDIGCLTWAIAVADFNNDQRDDVVATCYDDVATTPTNGVRVLLNKNLANVAMFGSPLMVDPQNGASGDRLAVAAGTFNGDDKRDIVLAHYSDNTLVLLYGKGDGAFSYNATTQRIAVGNNPDDIGVGRVNGDMIDDIVVANYGSDDMTLLSSVTATPGTFVATRLAYDSAAMMTTIGFPYSPIIADLNDDGRGDIVVAEAYSNPGTPNYGYLGVFLQAANGMFPVQPNSQNHASESAILAAAADFNCDGKLDLASGSYQAPEVEVLLQMANTTFPIQAPRVTLPTGANGIAVADFNRDGYPDIATGSRNTAMYVILNTH
jgi:hypothetical protein